MDAARDRICGCADNRDGSWAGGGSMTRPLLVAAALVVVLAAAGAGRRGDDGMAAAWGYNRIITERRGERA